MRALISFCTFFTIQTYATTSTFDVKKTLEISPQSLVVDGLAKVLLCPHDSKFKSFATIKFDKFALNLQCHNDYLGGIILEGYPKFRLAGISGDAGNTWGEISKLELKGNKLKLYRMLFSKKDPSVDCEYIPPSSSKKFKDFCKGAKIECKTSYDVYTYDGEKFIESQKNISKAPTSFSLNFSKNLKAKCGKFWND